MPQYYFCVQLIAKKTASENPPTKNKKNTQNFNNKTCLAFDFLSAAWLLADEPFVAVHVGHVRLQ